MTEPMTLVTGGVDTHVPAALDERGGEPGIESFPATAARYSKLLSWLNSFGTVKRVGVQDTACYGAGLSRYLQPKGIEVIEVDRPNRHLRRRAGKSDPVDATGAARAAQSSQTTAIAKTVDGDLEISVNVSARQLVSAGLATTVTEVADRTGVAPDQLCLEVTETALVDQPEIAIANLASLLDLGIDIALDDFRTGHASPHLFAYVAHHPHQDRPLVHSGPGFQRRRNHHHQIHNRTRPRARTPGDRRGNRNPDPTRSPQAHEL